MSVKVLSESAHDSISYDFEIRKPADIPKFCTFIARFAASQRHFEKWSLLAKFSIIPLNSYLDARICELFNRNALEILGEQRAWHFRLFMENYEQHIHSQMIHGIVLSTPAENTPCPIEELETTYYKVLENLTGNWRKVQICGQQFIEAAANLKYYFQKDPNKFYLLYKPKILFAEDQMLLSLAKKFSLLDSIECFSDFVMEGFINRNFTYLWIKKTDLLKVITQLELKVTENVAQQRMEIGLRQIISSSQ